MVAVPAGYADLLERPLYGHLATTRPDGSVQVCPMWFDWDGELLRFASASPSGSSTAMYRAARGLPCRSRIPTIRTAIWKCAATSSASSPIQRRASFGVLPTATADRASPDAPPRGEAPSDAPDWVVIVVRPTGFSKH